jgi:hypothetical protein
MHAALVDHRATGDPKRMGLNGAGTAKNSSPTDSNSRPLPLHALALFAAACVDRWGAAAVVTLSTKVKNRRWVFGSQCLPYDGQ